MDTQNQTTANSHDDRHKDAALYALHVLDAKARADFEEHLKAGCTACETEVRSLQQTAGLLGFATQPSDPPASLRARLLEQARKASAGAQTGSTVAVPEILFESKGLLISRPTHMDWAPTHIPKIWTKTLFVQGVRHYATSLVRMEPGAVYPPHRHKDVEEVYLIEGDLLVQGCRMGPGDYCRSEPGSIHDPASTKSGVLLLVLTSQQDELLI